MSPVDAVQWGAGFDEAGTWHEARPAAARWGDADDSGSAARGILLGTVISGAMWTGIFFAGRVLWTLLSR